MKRIIIDNIETKYLISENGEVFSEYKNIFLKSSTTQHGYSSVTLSVNGKKIRKYIHRLLAEYYLGFQEKGGRVINHIDGNKQNNNISNLEIISSSENLLHAYKMGLKEKNNKKTALKKLGNNLISHGRDHSTIGMGCVSLASSECIEWFHIIIITKLFKDGLSLNCFIV